MKAGLLIGAKAGFNFSGKRRSLDGIVIQDALFPGLDIQLNGVVFDLVQDVVEECVMKFTDL